MGRTHEFMLVHHHFNINSDEKLIEYCGTTVPWQKYELYQAVSATTWLICSDGIVRPYEFAYAPYNNIETTEPNPEKYTELVKFLQAFQDLLQKHGLVNVFGLCCYPGGDFLGRTEISRGTANNNLLSTDVRILFQLTSLTNVHRSHQT